MRMTPHTPGTGEPFGSTPVIRRVLVPLTSGKRTTQLLRVVQEIGKAIPLIRIVRTSSGAVPAMVMRFRLVEKSTPALDVIVKGDWLAAICESTTVRLLAIKLSIALGELMPAPAATMPL